MDDSTTLVGSAWDEFEDVIRRFEDASAASQGRERRTSATLPARLGTRLFWV